MFSAKNFLISSAVRIFSLAVCGLLLTTAKKQNLLINQDYLAALQQVKLTPAQALQILEACQTAIRQLESNATPRLTLSVLLLKIQTILKEV